MSANPAQQRSDATETHTTNEPTAVEPADVCQLRLYVAGSTPKSLTAQANLKRICEAYIGGCYAIEVIDLVATPALAKQDQILAIPTLVRTRPEPVRRIIGDLSNTEQVLMSLGVAAAAPRGSS